MAALYLGWKAAKITLEGKLDDGIQTMEYYSVPKNELLSQKKDLCKYY
jgi:hypothetical protein